MFLLFWYFDKLDWYFCDNNKFEIIIIINPICQQLSDDIFKRNKISNTPEDGKAHNLMPVY